MIMTSNTTQGTTTVTGSTQTQTSTTFTATFSNNNPSVHEAVSGSTTERIMIFRTANVNHTFTVPAGGLNCDILMIGGGASGGSESSSGGAGACIVAINQTLPAGSCVVSVGTGGVWNSGGVNGVDSIIQVESADRYRAKGGGSSPNGLNSPGFNGGCGGGASREYNGANNSHVTVNGGIAVSTNVVNGSPNIGPSITSAYAVMGNAGGNNGTLSNYGGGGGGIGTPAGITVGKAGDGAYQVTLTGAETPINFRNYFANGGNSFGVQDGSTGNYYIGGGGGGYALGYFQPGGLGGGGGRDNNGIFTRANDYYTGTGSGDVGAGAAGASGIIIIRYRVGISTTTTTTTYTHQPTTTTTLSTPTLGTPSIELVRGTQGDSNTDYKIGNYNGDFIVKSSANGVDSDYIRMLGTNGAIYNFTNSLYWTQTSDMRIKENIARASYDMCYDNIGKLELNRFNYIKEFNTGNKDTSQLGFIAQEIKDIFPKSVYTNSYSGGDLSIPDMLSIDIGQINYTLYGAVKKLMEINKDKEMRLKRLESLLNIEDGSCNVVVDTSNLVVNTSNVMVVDTSNVVVVDTSNVVVYTSNVVVDTSNVMVDTSNVVVDTSNLEN